MNNLQIFENAQFGEIRTILIEGKPYFSGSDVAKSLGYTNPTKAMNDHCRNIVTSRTNDSLGRQQDMKFIPEGDIYRLIVRSKLPQAEQFEIWVFDEVLPTIRKTGSYSIPVDKVPTTGEMFLQASKIMIDLEQKCMDLDNRTKVVEYRTKEMAHKLDKALEIKTVPTVDTKTRFQRDITMIAGLTGKATVSVYGMLYRELEKQTSCNLDIRLENLKQRMKQAGCMHREYSNASKLDAIIADRRLTRQFEDVVREIASTHCYEYIATQNTVRR